MKSTYFVLSLKAFIFALIALYGSAVFSQPLYWNEVIPSGGPGGNSAAFKLNRAQIDGTGSQTLLSTASNGLGAINSLAYEPNSQHLYWTTRSATQGLIKQSNLDGTNIQTLVSVSIFGQPNILRDLSIDPIHSTMYWADPLNDAISKANLDGTRTGFKT